MQGHPFLINPSSLSAEQCTELPIDPVFAMGLSDEVENRETILLRAMPQTAAELLEKHREALRRPQEKDEVNLRDVHTFTKDIHREKKRDLPRPEGLDSLVTDLRWRLTQQNFRAKSRFLKLVSHEVGMPHAGTKSYSMGIS